MPTLKKRTIPVDNISCAGCEQLIQSELVKMDGIQDVRVDHNKGEIHVAYDLLLTDMENIERTIEEMGYSVHDSFLERAKRKYIHFTEENERDNLNTPPRPCCS